MNPVPKGTKASARILVGAVVFTLILFFLFNAQNVVRGSGAFARYQLEAYSFWSEMGHGSASGGGVSDSPGSSLVPSLASSPTIGPIIAWTDNSGDKDIYVRRWDGAAWVEMGRGSASGGGISANSGSSYAPSLAIDASGAPIVAWADNSQGEYDIYVRRWDGAAWVEMGSGSASGGGISSNSGSSRFPSLAVAPDGTPLVAWTDQSHGDSEIYGLIWNGAAWVELGSHSASAGGISDNAGGSYAPALAISQGGIPIISWADNSGGGSEIYVRSWDGVAWVEMGEGSASGAGISANDGWSTQPSLAFGDDGMPMIAWSDDSSGDAAEIFVRRWDGEIWVEMGRSSASGGGVSANDGYSGGPSLSAGRGGMTTLFWSDDSGGDWQIYGRRWDGKDWLEMGKDSATGGGISSNGGSSWSAAAAIGNDGMPNVAWADLTSGTWNIYVRHWQILPNMHYLPFVSK